MTVNESVFPGRIGRSPEGRQPVQERFQMVPWPWNGPQWYVTGHRIRESTIEAKGERHGGLAREAHFSLACLLGANKRHGQ